MHHIKSIKEKFTTCLWDSRSWGVVNGEIKELKFGRCHICNSRTLLIVDIFPESPNLSVHVSNITIDDLTFPNW